MCGRLITRIEADDPCVVPILKSLYRKGGRAVIVGVTGTPGAGKSTVVDQLITRYRARSLRVGVLAIDPSSPFSGGAILGDRVRMGRHNRDAGVFIRSMSARGMLGGLAPAAADVLTVFDAMGVDRILIETVGVGQNEIDIVRFAHTILIVQTPLAGDGVQAVKAGILEIGNVFAVNKADTPGADRAASALREAIEFRHDPLDPGDWVPPVFKTHASEGKGIDELLDALERHYRFLQEHDKALKQHLRQQASARILSLFTRSLQEIYERRVQNESLLARLLDEVAARRSDPHSAVAHLLEHMP
jgi:LAO/AO transport system kinase